MFPTFSDSAVFGSQWKGTKLYIFTIQTTNSQFRSFHACVVILASPHQEQCAFSFLKRSLFSALDVSSAARSLLLNKFYSIQGRFLILNGKKNVEFPAVQGTRVRQHGPCLVWLADHRHGRLNLLRASLRRCKFKPENCSESVLRLLLANLWGLQMQRELITKTVLEIFGYVE